MDYGNLKVPENVTPEVQAILDSYEARNKEIENAHRKNMAKLYGGAALQIGSALIPGTLGLKGAGAAIKAITPSVGRKIAENAVTGTISGLASGAVEGIGRGLMDGENPWKTMVSDGAIGALLGGPLGLVGGKVAKLIDEKALAKGNKLPQQYFDEYVAGLSDNSALGKISPFSKEFGKFKGLRDNYTPVSKNTEIALDSNNPWHVEQADLIQKYNPADESLGHHTWIRNADDIANIEEAFNINNFSGTPDFSYSDAQKAIKDGSIKVYSSYPIDLAEFVTPSKMQAKDYAAGGDVFSAEVPINDIAWIDSNEGMYAPLTHKKYKLSEEPLKFTGKSANIDGINYKELDLGKAEYNRLMKAFNKDLSLEEQSSKMFAKPILDSNYYVVNKGFNEPMVTWKELLE